MESIALKERLHMVEEMVFAWCEVWDVRRLIKSFTTNDYKEMLLCSDSM